MPVAKTKKRYYLTLTKDTVDQIQEIGKTMRLPSTFISEVCDEALEKTLAMLLKIHSKGTFTMTDLFTMIGEQLEEANNEVKEREKETKTDAPKRKAKKTEGSGS